MTTMHAVLLGIIEGLTEFLPISSTGHLILNNYFLGYDLSSSFIQVFQISVQLGAVLAVVFYYFKDLIKLENIKLLLIGVLPTLVIGFLLKDYVKVLQALPTLIAYMLVLGGIFMILIELWYKKQNIKDREVNIKDSVIFGFAQSIAMIPGVSRSGAVIVTGLIMRYKREVIAKYAFLLAVPTMFAATGYSLIKNREVLISNSNNLFNLTLGFVSTFLTALIVLKLLIPFVKKYSFIPFGIYRIILGVSLLFLISH
jgi:undecaprenyl-diphosphatase